MNSHKQKQAVYLFEEYNRVLGEVYDQLLESVTDERALQMPEFQRQLQINVLNSIQPWFSQELDGLEDNTPEGFFDSLLALEDTLEVFSIAAQRIDGDMPDLLLLRLGAFGQQAAESLLDLALSQDWQIPSKDSFNEEAELALREQLAIPLAALRVLGQWQYEPAIKPFLDRFCSIEVPDELLADSMKTFCVDFGATIVPELLARIDLAMTSDLTGPFEYLIIYLTEIGIQEPSEEIFRCLKEAFRKMEHKVIGAICLGDYGDGRAIPLLKSYLERHIHEIDRQFFYETLSAIHRLGGDTKDIQDPFRDFQKFTPQD